MLDKGTAAPHFELTDQSGRTWKLDELAGKKVILFFYPADDTPGCTKEACDFRDSHSDLERAGYVVLGVSPQGPDSKRRFADKYSLNFPLLADEDGAVANAYGVFDPKGGEWQGIPMRVKRSTFVIDENGVVEHAQYGVKAGGHVDKLRDLLAV